MVSLTCLKTTIEGNNVQIGSRNIASSPIKINIKIRLGKRSEQRKFGRSIFMVSIPRDKNMNSTLDIAVIQTRCSPDGEANVDVTVGQIVDAARAGAKLICLQELFASTYFCQSENHEHFNLAQSIPGVITDRLSKLARELRIVIIAPLFERRAAGLFHNSAVIIESDGSLL